MKKTTLSLFILGISLLGINNTFASNCKEVEFSNGKVCVSIEKESTSTFSLNTEVENGSSNLRCALLLSDNSYKEVNCDGTFTLSSKKEQLVKLFIKMNGQIPTDWDGKPNDSATWNFPQWTYDFGDGSWADNDNNSNSDDNDDDNNNGDLDNFSISASPSSPDKNERIDITIKARDNDDDTIDDYRGSIRFKVERKSGSSWVSASSSSYSLGKTSYTFSSSDDGEKKFSDLLKLSSSYEYRLVVYDDDDTDVKNYKIFDLDGSSSSSSSSSDDLDNFYITSDDSTPNTNQRVDLGIKARDDNNSTVTDYTNTAKFKIYYRTSSSSSWTQTTSSTYFEVDSDYDDGYDFTSSDDGSVTLSDAIRFKKKYDYKVRIYDEDDSSAYGEKIFYVDGSSSSSNSSSDDLDNFYITSDDSTPNTNQRVDLGIKARDDNNSTVTDYTNTAKFKVYYRTSSSSSWTQTTSSTYFEVDSDYDDGYDFTSSDDGSVTLSDAIRFKKKYDYKVRIYDEDDSSIYGEKIFYVDGSSSSSSSSDDLDNFSITSDDSAPNTNQRVNLGIKARDDNNSTVTDYTNNVKFKVYYRTSSSSSWTQTTSSTYFEIDSDYDDGYDFTSSDDGSVTLSDAIKFYKSYDYKVRVYDEDDTSIYGEKIFYVDGSSSSSSSDDVDNFYISSDNASPSTNQRVDLYIKARDEDNTIVSDYTNAIKFKIYYRTSSSSSWIETSSSSYFEIDSDYEDGYDFSSSDDGYINMYDVIKFKKDYDFKVKAYDEDDSSIYGEKIFYIGEDSSSSDVDGFSTSELATVKKIYNSRSTTVSNMKTLYPSLKTNQTWLTMTNNLKTQMKYILDNSSARDYDTYDEFNTAFQKRYTYSINNK